jgi:host factor-I protein
VVNRNTSGGAFRNEDEGPANRKLIRPNLSDLADRYPTRSFSQRKQVPPEQTNAESYYYLKQMAAKTPMVVVLTDGEKIHGWIEWYDKNCLKVNRDGGPNLLVAKASIKYMYKASEGTADEASGNR